MVVGDRTTASIPPLASAQVVAGSREPSTPGIALFGKIEAIALRQVVRVWAGEAWISILQRRNIGALVNQRLQAIIC